MAVTFKNPGRIEFVGKIQRQEGGGTFGHDVEDAYKKARVLETYRSLSYSHQREYNLWIEDAKQPETRKRRIEKAIGELASKKAMKR